MGILTDDMRRVIDEQRLGFIATVTPDGKPNLSPKGTTTVWKGDQLCFADICSPNTVRNLKANPGIEINVVDNTLRKGYRFKGTAQVLSEGPLFEELMAFYRQRGTKSTVRTIVLMTVEHAEALISPAYDRGQSEEQVSAQWDRHWVDLRRRRTKAG
jgi:uncharacterized protein